MASSFISKDNIHGFWIDDSIMQVVCWGIVNKIDRLPLEGNEWLKGEFRELVFDNSQGIFNGFMHLRLDDFLNDKKKTEVVKYILVETIHFFENKGSFVSLEELNSFQKILETRHIWVEALDITRPIRALQFLEEVIEERFELTEEDNLSYEI